MLSQGQAEGLLSVFCFGLFFYFFFWFGFQRDDRKDPLGGSVCTGFSQASPAVYGRSGNPEGNREIQES